MNVKKQDFLNLHIKIEELQNENKRLRNELDDLCKTFDEYKKLQVCTLFIKDSINLKLALIFNQNERSNLKNSNTRFLEENSDELTLLNRNLIKRRGLIERKITFPILSANKEADLDKKKGNFNNLENKLPLLIMEFF